MPKTKDDFEHFTTKNKENCFSKNVFSSFFSFDSPNGEEIYEKDKRFFFCFSK